MSMFRASPAAIVTAAALCIAALPSAGRAQGDPVNVPKPDLKAHPAVDPNAPGPWKFGVDFGINLSQSGYTDNWAGGDMGSVGWLLKFDGKADRQVSSKFNSSTLLQLGYGQTTLQEADPADPTHRRWRSPEKTSDLILLESVGRFTLQRIMDPYLAFRLDSVFLDDTDPIGTFEFNPLKLTETAGLARVFSKTENSELIGRVGFGFRETHGRVFADSTGDKISSFWTTDGGLELQFTSTQPLLDKRVLYQGKLLFFYPLFYSSSGALQDFDELALAVDPTRAPVADYWQTVDINFQNTFTTQITKVLTVNLYMQLVYDKFDAATNVDTSIPIDMLVREVDGGVRKAVQLKQTLALGLTFKLI